MLKCKPTSVRSDATYCVEDSPTCSGSQIGACPKHNAIAIADCFDHLASYNPVRDECQLHFTSTCQLLPNEKEKVYGCIPTQDCHGQGRSQFAGCNTDSDCGNWNGHPLKCSENSVCICPTDDCSQGMAFDARMFGQSQECDAKRECQGAGTICNRDEECYSCAEINECIPFLNNSSIGTCMPWTQCENSTHNCAERIHHHIIDTEPDSQVVDTPKPTEHSSFGLQDESLTIQIATSVIVLVLIVACVTICCFRVKFKKDRAFKDIEQDWQGIETPNLSTPSHTPPARQSSNVI